MLALALLASPAAARDFAGRYRATEGPDVAGQLELRQDGRFGYEFAAGALDERAQGRWVARQTPAGPQACLTTEPKPVAPVLQPAPVPADQDATVFVAWPDGRGIAGVDFIIGFDHGEPLSDYTQGYGWTLPADEHRTPRWIELIEPIYRVPLARTAFPPPPADHAAARFRAVLIPNDIGVVDFQNACLEPAARGFVLHRAEGDMRFVAEKR